MITKHNGKEKNIVSLRFKRKNKFYKTPQSLQIFFVTWPFAKLEMMEILHSYHSVWKHQRPRHIEAPAFCRYLCLQCCVGGVFAQSCQGDSKTNHIGFFFINQSHCLLESGRFVVKTHCTINIGKFYVYHKSTFSVALFLFPKRLSEV